MLHNSKTIISRFMLLLAKDKDKETITYDLKINQVIYAEFFRWLKCQTKCQLI